MNAAERKEVRFKIGTADLLFERATVVLGLLDFLLQMRLINIVQHFDFNTIDFVENRKLKPDNK